MKSTYVEQIKDLNGTFERVSISIAMRVLNWMSSWLQTIPSISQRAKKVVSDSPGLVDLAIWPVNSVLNLPDG